VFGWLLVGWMCCVIVTSLAERLSGLFVEGVDVWIIACLMYWSVDWSYTWLVDGMIVSSLTITCIGNMPN
jgi:hypothetical protein